MSTCSVCNKDFEDKYFDAEQNKCILHCEKDDWYEMPYALKNWSKSEDKIKLFWQQIRTKIFQAENEKILDLKNVIFPQFEDPKITKHNRVLSDTFNFIECHKEGLTNVFEPDLLIDVSINFTGAKFLDNVNFDYYKFKEFTCFNNVEFYGKCNFQNTEFNKVTFNNCNFYKEVIFENSILNFIDYDSEKDFENTIFHDDIKFYTSMFSTVKSKKAYDIKFMGTQFKRIYIMGCDFEKGICFFRDTKADIIAINSATINFLYIESDVPNVHISNNKKEINRLIIKHNTLKSLTIHNTIVKKDFLLNKEQYKKRDTFELDLLNLKESTFESKVKIQFYDIQDASFYNTKFQDLADFYNTKFNEVVFERTDFEKIAVFSEVEFHQDVDFKYTKFLGKSIFRDTVIKGKLNLRDTIFDNEANFLDITSISRKKYNEKTKEYEFIGEPKDIKVANRETARIIKNFYDNSNNIIEANKFYALEMKEREKELIKDIKNGKNIVDWLIFKAHAISSNHSQDWLLALFWIIVIGALYTIISFCSTNTCLNNINTPILIGSIFLVSLYNLHVYNKNDYKQFTKYIFLFLLLVNYFALTKDVTLSCLADKINPFSIMTSKDPITFGLLMFKITIAYLIYQFIVSVRQNTRRK